MSSVEKNKKSKKSKKTKKAKTKAKGKADAKTQAKKGDNESDVLERVMDSIEMAGASLNFFDESDGDEQAAPVQDPEVSEQRVEALQEEAGAEVSEPEAVVENNPEDVDSAELEMLSDESDAVTGGEDDLDKATEAEVVADTDSSTDDNLEVAGEDGEAISEDSDDMTDAETMDMLEDDNQTEFIEQKQALSIIESLLFSSDRPLGLGTFKQVFKGTSYKTKDIKNALEELQVEYADPARGVSLEEINGGWQLRTKVDNMEFLRKLAKARPFKLSGPALEVLAIIAYKQPIIKSEVDEIRGVESGHLVRALMEKHLVNFQGKSELPGKPMQYGTTRKFLEIFGLRNLRELPSLDEIDQLLPDGIGIEEDEEKLSDVTDKMAEEFSGTYSEGEEELEKIEATLGDIDTSSEFFEQEKQKQKEKRDRDRARDLREALDVGEEVDPKDQRWLERYDAKIAEEAEAKAQAEALALAEDEARAAADSEDTSADDVETSDHESMAAGVNASTDELGMDAADGSMSEDEVSEPLSEELSQLTAQSEPLVSEDVMAADEEMERLDDDSDSELPDSAETFDPFQDEDDESLT